MSGREYSHFSYKGDPEKNKGLAEGSKALGQCVLRATEKEKERQSLCCTVQENKETL